MSGNDDFYLELLQSLRFLIEAKFGSVAAFCRENSISRQNLTEVFQGRQDISVGLFLRIASSLGVVGPLPTLPQCVVSLRDYLAVDHDCVIRALLSILLRG